MPDTNTHLGDAVAPVNAVDRALTDELWIADIGIDVDLGTCGVSARIESLLVPCRDDERVLTGDLGTGCGSDLAPEFSDAAWTPIRRAILAEFLPI